MSKAEKNSEYPGRLNPMAEEMIRLGRDPLSAESYTKITPQFANLTRRSAINDRVIEQMERGIDYFATVPSEELNGQIDALAARIHELTAASPAYRPSSTYEQGPRRPSCARGL